MVPASSYNQGFLGPLFPGNDPPRAFHVYPFRFHNRKTPDSAGVATENVGAPAVGQIPYSDRPICRSAYKGVLTDGKSPNTASVAIQGAKQLPGYRGIYVYRVVIRGRDNPTM